MSAPTATVDAPTGRVPFLTKLSFGFGATAFGIKDNGFSVFLLLYYNQVIGLDSGKVGLVLLIALLLDALIDPSVGHLSDRTRTRWGRRHPWLYASALPIAGFWLLLWAPPAVGEMGQLLWLLVFATLVRMSLSINEIPSIALAPEMTEDRHERTSILGLRYFFGWFGGLLILALAYGYFHMADPARASRDLYWQYAVVGAAVMFIAVLVSAIGTHRRFARPRPLGEEQPSLADMLVCLRFKPFLILLSAAFFLFAAQGVTFALSSYLLVFVWHFGSAQQVIYAFCLLAGVMMALPLSRRLGERFGKKPTAVGMLFATMIVNALPYLLFVAGLFPATRTADGGMAGGAILYLAFVTASTGLGVTVMITAASLMADVTTAHRQITGRAQEGVFFSGHFFMQKCVTGVGIFLSGQLLAAISFPARADPATIDQAVVQSLALAFVCITMVLQTAGMIALSRFALPTPTPTPPSPGTQH